MRSLVNAKVAGGGEALPTSLTHVRAGTGVNGLVLSEALLTCETLPADVAHEGLDFGVRQLVIAESTRGGEGAVAGAAAEWRLLEPVGGLVGSELSQQSELPVALVTTQQLVRVVLLRRPQLVAQLVFVQRGDFVETFITQAAWKRLQVTRRMFVQLMFLMKTFVTQFTEKTLLSVQLPPPPPLCFPLLVISQPCTNTQGFYNIHKTHKPSPPWSMGPLSLGILSVRPLGN